MGLPSKQHLHTSGVLVKEHRLLLTQFTDQRGNWRKKEHNVSGVFKSKEGDEYWSGRDIWDISCWHGDTLGMKIRKSKKLRGNITAKGSTGLSSRYRGVDKLNPLMAWFKAYAAARINTILTVPMWIFEQTISLVFRRKYSFQESCCTTLPSKGSNFFLSHPSKCWMKLSLIKNTIWMRKGAVKF